MRRKGKGRRKERVGLRNTLRYSREKEGGRRERKEWREGQGETDTDMQTDRDRVRHRQKEIEEHATCIIKRYCGQ